MVYVLYCAMNNRIVVRNDERVIHRKLPPFAFPQKPRNHALMRAFRRPVLGRTYTPNRRPLGLCEARSAQPKQEEWIGALEL